MIIFHFNLENPIITKAKDFLLNDLEAPMDTVLYILQKEIGKCLKENDRILKIQEINKNFDFLNYWIANNDGEYLLKQKIISLSFKIYFSDPIIEMPVASLPGKLAKGKKPSKEKVSTKKQVVKDPVEELLVKVDPAIYITKNWSSLPLRGQNSNKKVCNTVFCQYSLFVI